MKLINKLKSNPVAQNASWMIFEKLFRLGLNFIVSIWIAKYLGPSDFGLLNYALAIAVIFGAFSELGLSSLITKELVEHPENKNKILGTSFIVRLVSSIFIIILIFTVVSYSNTDQYTKLLIIILSIIILAQSVDVIDLWFQSIVKSKYTVMSRNIGLFLSSILKIIFILYNLNIVFIAVAFLSEYIFTAGLLILYYKKKDKGELKWIFDKTTFKYLLKSSWPLFFSTVATMIYLKTDQIMLKQLKGNHEVGIYSVVVRLTEVWYFVPNAIVASIYPSLIQLRKFDKEKYFNKLQKIFDFLFMLSISLVIPISLFSSQIVNLLFGYDYLESGPVLSVQIWTSIFIFSSVLLNKWLINENLFIFTFISSLTGALTNVLLNFYLIPRYGALGSSYATLISYIFSTVVFCFFSRKTIYIGIIIIKSYFFPFRFIKASLKKLRS